MALVKRAFVLGNFIFVLAGWQVRLTIPGKIQHENGKRIKTESPLSSPSVLETTRFPAGLLPRLVVKLVTCSCWLSNISIHLYTSRKLYSTLTSMLRGGWPASLHKIQPLSVYQDLLHWPRVCGTNILWISLQHVPVALHHKPESPWSYTQPVPLYRIIETRTT